MKAIEHTREHVESTLDRSWSSCHESQNFAADVLLRGPGIGLTASRSTSRCSISTICDTFLPPGTLSVLSILRKRMAMWTAKNRGRYDRSKLRYPSDLIDEEWAHVEPLIPPAKAGGNKRRSTYVRS
jgi:hypothetical protein